MSFERALAEARASPRDPGRLEQLARQALDHGEEERALSVFRSAPVARSNARTMQWRGLLERALDRLDDAVGSFEAAAALAPADPGIAHGLARATLEAGLPAEARFERALQLAPQDSQVLAGLVAARLAGGHGEQGERELAAIVARHPAWIDGHMQLAQLRSMLGKSDSVAASLETALAAAPRNADLWFALFDLHIKREAFGDLDTAIGRARQHGIATDLLVRYCAVASGELGRTDEADRLFERWDDGTDRIWRIRHLLRSGRPEQALAVIDSVVASDQANHAWPYASIAWKLMADPRSDWLEGGEGLIRTFDLTDSRWPLDRLAEALRAIHLCKGQYLDQSVRGGTQTDGPLFSRVEPEIRALRAAAAKAVADYVAALPSFREGHPLLGRRRDRPVRFAGSWSVRLRGAGYHTPHVHPQGWISSAFYVAVPDCAANAEAAAGWLAIGQPPTGLAPSAIEASTVQPKPGRLVLFPSWMWHGTYPFESGERLTIAFDVAPPR